MNEPIVERMLDENPLIAFSPFTHGQVEILRDLATRLFAELDRTIGAGQVDGQGFQRCYAMFWLWVLGAYEVTRTMSQARSCFSEQLASRITEFKKRIAKLRMPFAKQEYAGRKQPIGAEPSVSGIDCDARDFSFAVEQQLFSVRETIAEFLAVFDGIKRDDILRDHRRSYDSE